MRAFLTVFWLATAAWAGDHLCVILDNSRSMLKNDSPRLAALATVLLYDLANPNLSRDDTFQVLTFDPTWPLGMWKSGPPPVQTGPRLTAVHGARAAFVAQVKALAYNGWNTYYYPVLRLAIDDLKSTPGGGDDRRVIVLVTDGLPEDPDTSLIQRDLIKELEPANIRLYILAFGPEASTQSAKLQSILGGSAVGDLFVDPTGSDLIEDMVRIFSRSFGYTADSPLSVSGPQILNLEGGQTPSRVAVISYWRKPAAPRLRLSAPPSGVVNTPDGVRSTEEIGASYAVAWALTPNKGLYSLAPDSPGSTVAVLRPATLVVEVQPQNHSSQTQSTMSGVEFPLRMLVRPSGGARGDPGLVEMSYQVHGSRTSAGFEWDGKKEGPPNSAGIAVPEGRYFDVFPTFPADRGENREFYEGWLSVELRRKQAVIGSTLHRILVYPYVQLSPTPSIVSGMVSGQVRAIRRREMGCATFDLRLKGTLPHPNRPSYSLRAVVDKRLIGDPRLVLAQFTLDNISLDYDGAPRHNPQDWYTGRRLNQAELLGPHEICVQVGKPKFADPGVPVEIPVQFTLVEAPYDTLPAIERLTLKALVAPPTLMQKYGAWIAAGLGMLTLLLLAWYGRYRPALPPALRWAVVRKGSEAMLAPGALGQGSLVSKLLGLIVGRPVYADGGAVHLGWVRPVDAELYCFRCVPGVVVDGGGERADDGYLLAAHRTYIARCVQGDYRFRLEFH